MKQNYEECLSRLLKDEGGYTNNPNDAGGPTNYGITIADYKRYVNPDATATDVKNMKLADAKAIYRKRYWDAINADALPSGIDYCVFDYGVNSGVVRAKKILAKFDSITDPVEKINAICDERLAYMKGIRGGQDWKIFGRGWTNRVAGVRKRSIELAKSIPAPSTVNTGTVVATTSLGTTMWAFGSHYWPYAVAIGAAVLIGYAVYDFLKFRKIKNAKPLV